MVDRRDVGSWLEGPGAGARADGRAEQAFPGQRLGRPQDGAGSVAPVGRRLLGLTVDWIACVFVARALLGADPLGPLLVFAIENAVLVGTLGATLGHRVAGLGVERFPGGLPGPTRAVGRTILLCLVVPALIWDADQRGLHDKAAGTLVVRR
jgi:uncharacterized RDD family membrane protein YckC